jgi:hypothetical protein
VIADVVARWHAFIRGELPGGLDELLDDDVVFYSPIVFTPQRGKQVTALYLQAAAQTFGGGRGHGGGRGGEAAEAAETMRRAASITRRWCSATTPPCWSSRPS